MSSESYRSHTVARRAFSTAPIVFSLVSSRSVPKLTANIAFFNRILLTTKKPSTLLYLGKFQSEHIYINYVKILSFKYKTLIH